MGSIVVTSSDEVSVDLRQHQYCYYIREKRDGLNSGHIK